MSKLYTHGSRAKGIKLTKKGEVGDDDRRLNSPWNSTDDAQSRRLQARIHGATVLAAPARPPADAAAVLAPAEDMIDLSSSSGLCPLCGVSLSSEIDMQYLLL
jgi:hypothetical protein